MKFNCIFLSAAGMISKLKAMEFFFALPFEPVENKLANQCLFVENSWQLHH